MFFKCQHFRSGSNCRQQLDEHEWCQECTWAAIYVSTRDPEDKCGHGYSKGCERHIMEKSEWCPWCRGQWEAEQNLKQDETTETARFL